MKRLVAGIGGAGLVLFGAMMLCGQEARRGGTDSGGPYPRIPGAISKVPAGIGKGAPFDVARFFAAPPAGRNAAPLYLDALFEFGPELATCFPEGPERDRRRQAAEERSRRYGAMAEAYFKDPKSVPTTTIDEIIGLYDTGFRKLAEAQRREPCVFEMGLGFTAALVPHAQVARQVARIADLRVRRALEHEDFEAAIREVEMVLRLVRDLQPRGPIICQLVASAITNYAGTAMIAPILVARRLRVEHCDRLLKVLVAHEAKSIDGYVEGLRGQYLLTRVGLQDLIRNPRELAKELGEVKPGESGIKAILGRIGGPDAARSLPEDVDARIARTTPAELARQVEIINGAYRALLSLDGVPYASRIPKLAAVRTSTGADPLSLLVKGLSPDSAQAVALAHSIARSTATLHAMECWAALRRWQLSFRGRSPRELASAVKAAGLKSVPADPYDGKPIRMATLNGRPIIYSVGKDGKDDGGQSDSKLDSLPSGDLIYRPEPIEARR